MKLTEHRRQELLSRVQTISGRSIGVLLPLHNPPKDRWREGHIEAFTYISGCLGEVLSIAEEALQP